MKIKIDFKKLLKVSGIKKISLIKVENTPDKWYIIINDDIFNAIQNPLILDSENLIVINDTNNERR